MRELSEVCERRVSLCVSPPILRRRAGEARHAGAAVLDRRN